jgi:hypothetical protein
MVSKTIGALRLGSSNLPLGVCFLLAIPEKGLILHFYQPEAVLVDRINEGHPCFLCAFGIFREDILSQVFDERQIVIFGRQSLPDFIEGYVCLLPPFLLTLWGRVL